MRNLLDTADGAFKAWDREDLGLPHPRKQSDEGSRAKVLTVPSEWFHLQAIEGKSSPLSELRFGNWDSIKSVKKAARILCRSSG
jgi:hypothetical protein